MLNGKRTGKVLTIILCVFMCAGLAACGGNGRERAGGGSSPAASKEKAEDGGLSDTLVYAGESEDTINPLLNSHDELPNIIFSGLLKYDAGGKAIPDLAESCDFDEPSLTYTFHLRDGVTWHDGETFSAADVVFTYGLLTQDKTLASTITSNYEDIEKVTAPDEKTVVITMKQYNAAMPGYFTIGILPEHLLKGQDINTASFNQKPVGTGRYKFVSWEKEGGIINLQRNTDYYGKAPNIERIIYKTVSVESTKATMLKSGEADLAWLNANYAKTFRGDGAYQNIDFATADYRGISMDFRTEFWQKNKDSIGVLNYALDKAAIVKGVLAGRGVPAYSPLQINPYGGNKEADIYSYDLKKFDREMEKLGWVKNDGGIYERNGEKFHFTVQVRNYEEERVDIANICSSQLKQAGVEMEVVPVTQFDWTSGYNGFLSGYATPFDPDMLYVNYVTGASDNNMQYSNPKVDELLQAARHTSNEDVRKDLYHQFETEYSKNPGIVLVAYLDGSYVAIKGLKGLDTARILGHHAVGVFWNVEEWTLNK